jgi:hypothetical protein
MSPAPYLLEWREASAVLVQGGEEQKLGIHHRRQVQATVRHHPLLHEPASILATRGQDGLDLAQVALRGQKESGRSDRGGPARAREGVRRTGVRKHTGRHEHLGGYATRFERGLSSGRQSRVGTKAPQAIETSSFRGAIDRGCHYHLCARG